MRPQLFRARWILPVVSTPISDGEILVGEDGRIVAVAPAGALDLPSEVEIHSLGEAILLPGLVNVHAHPELAMFRGALEDLEFPDWILKLVGAKRTLLLEEDYRAAALWTLVESLAAGITTIGATETSGASVQAMADAGVRGIVYQEVFGPDPAQAETSMGQLRSDVGRLTSAATELVRVGVSPHAPYTVSDRLYQAVTQFARDERLPMAVHIAESRAERDLVVGGTGAFASALGARGILTQPRARTSIDLLDRLGVLDERPLLIHCLDIDDEDISRIAETDSPIAHCPVANARLGHGVAPILSLLETGVTVGIGTDSVASNNRLDLLEEARIASLLQRASTNSFHALPSDQLLKLCTIDGARALGLESRIGSLEPGKDADLCAVSIETFNTVPNFNPLAALFHAGRGSDVVLTAVRGRILYRAGKFTTIDVPAARTGVEAASSRLKAGFA